MNRSLVCANITGMKIFILDDGEERHQTYIKRYPGHWFIRAYTFAEAVKKLEDGPFDIAFFDHDLCDWYKEQSPDGSEILRERTGLDVVEHMLERVAPTKWPREAVVHSWNGSRGPLMTALLQRNGVPATYQPFTP